MNRKSCSKTMAIKSLSDDQHLARHCPKNRLVEQEGKILILPQAFSLRPGEKYLSTTWMEHFAGTKKQRVKLITEVMRKRRSVSAKDGFAIGNVREIKGACLEFGIKIRVNHAPKSWNAAYSSVNNYVSESQELLSLLAAEAWADLVLIKDC